LPVDEVLPSIVEVYCEVVRTAELEREETDDAEEKTGVNVDEGVDSTDLVDWNDVTDGLLPVANRSSRGSTSHLHLNKYRPEYGNT
jgi:hypothetical protein